MEQLYRPSRNEYRGKVAKTRFERDCLSEYAEVFKTVCVDAAYYTFPRLEYLHKLADTVPDDFRFRFKGEQWMAAAAYNPLWTVRGIPCLYYGEEIEFMKGAPQDVIGNDDTLDQTERAYFGDHLTEERIAATQSHPLYQHIKRLNQIRRAIPALQKGVMSHINEWGSGMRFVRDHNHGESYAVMCSTSATTRRAARTS